MDINEIIKLILSVAGAITVVFGGIGFAIYTYKKSGRQERKDVTETADVISVFWKGQADKLEEILRVKDSEFNAKIAELTKEFNEKIQELTKQVGVLTGQLASEKAANERLEKIFQNRSPEMEQFMKYMVNATEKHFETHEAMLRVLTDLHERSNQETQLKDVKIEGQMETKPIS